MTFEPRTCCITCGKVIPYGRSRCRDHGGNWQGAGQSRGHGWSLLAKRVVAEEPSCHWGFEGCTVASTEADHLKPRALGGLDDRSNLVGSCRSCNHKRGS